jgi:hypothetical protein
MEEREKWTDAEINALPDSAFAVIAPGGKKDKGGKTSPRTLRYFPHHNPNGAVDKAHVDNAASRIPKSSLDSELKAKAEAHIEAHQKELGEDVDSKSAKTSMERRFVVQEVRLATRDDGADGTATTFEGYAALFNSRTWIGPPKFGFWEQIAPGAFRDAIANNADVVCLFNHDMNYLLGRTASGTLQIREDDHGLWAVDDLPPTQLGRDLAVQVARGDVRGMSFSFSIPQGGDRWEILPDGSELRTIETVGDALYDVSPVVSPAYTDTTASVRAVELGRRNAPVLTGLQSGDTVSDDDTDDDDTGSGGDDDGNREAKTANDDIRSLDEPEDWREELDARMAYVMHLRSDLDGNPLF